ncbi:HEPN_AbiU2 domain-containing protein [Pseudomonas sp. IT-P44]|uniref:AbiU2 domain-containing protein n=1 Tax=Pseudomonas sp. IT-P44 TaxID=3026451 RepID=UPI0039E09746
MFDLEEALRELSRYNSYITDIRREVLLYEQLYCSEDSLAIINANLMDVFKIVQKSMFVSILTRVSAVFDSKSFGSDPNLSLDYFEYKYREFASEKLLNDFEAIKGRYKALNIKNFRDKLIAHNDQKTIFGDSSITHSIKNGDVMKLLNDARGFCIDLCYCLPGGIQTVLEVVPWELKKGRDGLELLRRMEAGK